MPQIYLTNGASFASQTYSIVPAASATPVAPVAPVAPVIPAAPTAPVLNAATSITSTGFSISWTGATGATSYTYTLSPSTGYTVFTYKTVAKTGSFTGLSTGIAYSLTIAAVNAGGSTVSNPITVTTIPTVSVNASSITQSQATITWGAYAGATGYTVEYWNGSHLKPTVTPFVVNGQTFSTTIAGLSAGNIYVVQVKATNGATILATFPSREFSTLPATPTLETATSITSSGFSITWL